MGPSSSIYIFQDVVQSNTVSTARLAGIIKVLANMSDYPVASGQLQLPVVFVVFLVINKISPCQNLMQVFDQVFVIINIWVFFCDV